MMTKNISNWAKIVKCPWRAKLPLIKNHWVGLSNFKNCPYLLEPLKILIFLFLFFKLINLFELEANYFTVLWWFLPYIDMNLPRVYMCSPSWTRLPPPSASHPSGSSQCTSPEHPVSCIEPGLAIYFTYNNIHVSTLFSQIIPPSLSPTESRSLFFTSVFLLLSHI